MSGTSGKMEGLSSLLKPESHQYSAYRYEWVRKLINVIYRRQQPT